MDLNNELRHFLSYFCDDDIDVFVERVRGKLPNGVFAPDKTIVVRGTQTSLARWGLIEILMHELAHYRLYREGYRDWNKHDDRFWEVYREIRSKYDQLVDGD